jgi:hypothetical protein
MLKQDSDKKMLCYEGTRHIPRQNMVEKVWKLKVPPKIRVFWWKALQNYLPVKIELQRHHVA